MGAVAVSISSQHSAAKTTGAANGLSVSTAPATWISGYAYNPGVGTIYVLIFDSATSTIADTTVPTLPPIVCAADGNCSLDFLSGINFNSGIQVKTSSTSLTLTSSGTAFIAVTYKKI